MWAGFALLSALFAALTSILAKLGMEGINSNLATALRTIVVLVMAWGIVFATGKHTGIGDITAVACKHAALPAFGGEPGRGQPPEDLPAHGDHLMAAA